MSVIHFEIYFLLLQFLKSSQTFKLFISSPRHSKKNLDVLERTGSNPADINQTRGLPFLQGDTRLPTHPPSVQSQPPG